MINIFAVQHKPEKKTPSKTTFLSSIAKNAPTERITNLNKSRHKKRILLLVDMYDWCFYNIASRIKKQLSSKYIFDILTTVDFYNNIDETLKNPYDIYLFFYPTGAFVDPRKSFKLSQSASLWMFFQIAPYRSRTTDICPCGSRGTCHRFTLESDPPR